MYMIERGSIRSVIPDEIESLVLYHSERIRRISSKVRDCSAFRMTPAKIITASFGHEGITRVSDKVFEFMCGL
jgi:hypothetical protein